ncbi:TPA: acyl-phosphate glycerol 3-phosphate acyltransferase [bacterium]|nr:acyl-phosphate glycerol 3-phosphate acyltransferase [bacterium]
MVWIISIFSYLVGSIPVGLILGLLKKRDIRKEGSGNIGFTNVWRVLGIKYAIPVLVFDVLKGFLPVVIGIRFSEGIGVIAGLSAILGHSFSIFLKFKGGKGVATSCGVFLGLCPIETILAMCVFLIVLIISRYVSVGSLFTSLLLPIFIFIFSPDKKLVFGISIIAFLFIWIKHIPNIKRLIKGSELKI